jgi:shikimate kinase
LLLGNVRGQLADLMSRREPVYEAAATISVDTSDLTVEQVVSSLTEQLGNRA